MYLWEVYYGLKVFTLMGNIRPLCVCVSRPVLKTLVNRPQNVSC